MVEKIVLVTAGGHISSFHAAMKKMHETLNSKAPGKFELWGADGGLEGLVSGKFIPIKENDIDENLAGSLIGADRKVADSSKVAEVIKANKDIYAVVMMGGDNHLGEAAKLYKEAGINIVGYPKTMDGDLNSLITLGWESAVTVGAIQTRNHHTSAMTYKRVFYVGLFGRNTDWTTAGVYAYGGADRAIPCEQEYEFEYIWSKIEESLKQNKEKYGKEFAVVPYSEGAKIIGVNEPPKEHCSYDAHNLPKLQPEWLGMELVRLTKKIKKKDSAFQAHTYDMRDSPPTETDKKLSGMAGSECVCMIIDGDFGKSAVFSPVNDFYEVGRMPLEKVAVQRMLKPTGFFDYDELKTNKSFTQTYSDLFRKSLGNPPTKDDLVYRNLRRK